MKRHLLSTIFTLMSCFSLFAQSAQRVVVYEYKERGGRSPLSNVEVVVNNAGSTVTDKQGQCILTFRTLKPGDKVTIRRIEKPGFEIFNHEQFDQWYISRNPNEVFEILMVSSKTLGNIRGKYEKSAYSAINAEKMQRESVIDSDFQKGLIKKEEYDKKIQEIEDEYNKRLDDIDNYIEHFSRLDLGKISAQEKQIIEKLREGDIEGAIADYESAGLINLYRNAISNLSKLSDAQNQLNNAAKKSLDRRDQLFGSIKNQFNLLVNIGGKDNISKARNILRDVAFSDSTYYPAVEYFADWSNQARFYEDAKRAYEDLRISNDSIYIFKGITGLSAVNVVNGQYDHANFDNQLNALNYYTRIAIEREDTTLFLDERTRCLSRMLNYCCTAHQESEGLEYIDKAIGLASRWHEISPSENSLRRLYDIYCYISRIYSRLPKKQYEPLQLKSIDQAIKASSELYWQNTSKYGAILAYAYTLKGNFYNYSEESRNIKLAAAEYSLAEQLYEEMFQKNPESYVSHLITCYHNHARLFFEEDLDVSNYRQSLNLLDKVKYFINLQEQIAPGNRGDLRLGELYYSYASCYSMFKDWEKVKENIDQSYNLIAPFIEEYPQTYKSQKARAMRVYSNYYLNKENPDYDKAINYAREAASLYPSNKTYKELLNTAIQKKNED